jgi:hypothetical protein
MMICFAKGRGSIHTSLSGFAGQGTRFAGVIYGHQRLTGVGQMVEDLSLIAQATQASDWFDRIEYLPL